MHTHIILNMQAMGLQLKKIRDHPHVRPQKVLDEKMSREVMLGRLTSQPHAKPGCLGIDAVSRIEPGAVGLGQVGEPQGPLFAAAVEVLVGRKGDLSSSACSDFFDFGSLLDCPAKRSEQDRFARPFLAHLMPRFRRWPVDPARAAKSGRSVRKPSRGLRQ